MSRFESNLAAELADESNEQRRWTLRLRLAAYRARRGEFDAAKNEISQARLHFAHGASAQITSYINFAEGITEYFENGAAAALMKLHRAKVLSAGGAPGDDLQSLVSVWLATTYRVLGQWEKMSAELADVFPDNQHISAETRARAGIVLADAWQEVFSYSKADTWYRIARKNALECGDDMTISAMLYNRAAIRVFNMRIREVQEEEIDAEECSVAIEAASAENYSQYTHDRSMQWVFEVLKGQVLMLKKDYRAAHDLLDSPTIRDLEKDWPAVEFLRSADILRCRASSQQPFEVGVVATAFDLVERFKSRVGAGDMAAACLSLHFALLKVNPAAADEFLLQSRVAVEKFMIERQQESVALDGFLDRVSSRASFLATMQ